MKFGVETWREAGEAAGRVYMVLVSEGPKTYAELVHGMKEEEALKFQEGHSPSSPSAPNPNL